MYFSLLNAAIYGRKKWMKGRPGYIDNLDLELDLSEMVDTL